VAVFHSIRRDLWEDRNQSFHLMMPLLANLNFMLLFWIPNAAHKYDVISEINHAIDAGFRKHGSEIPFPQRDLHLRSADGTIRFRQEND
jgi:small-conductance mechanosensitive channel